MEILNDESRSRLGELSSHIIEYLDTRWDLFLLQLTEKSMNAISGLVSGLLLVLFGSIILIFASIGAAISISQAMDSPAAGYFIMAGVFVVLLVLAIVFARNYIRNAVSATILESIKDDDTNAVPSKI
ncbi:MAG: phage holin family protein [Saprospiraceae bacterium]|nr:phage holin family protein [Saprospiraceae bacterium]